MFDLSFRAAVVEESDLLADIVLGDANQETTRVGMALYGIDSPDRIRALFRVLWRVAENWRHTELVIADGRPVGLIQAGSSGSSSVKITPGVVLAVVRTLGVGVRRVPSRLRIQRRVAPAKPLGSFVITEIHVVPEFRGMGIGDALLDHAEDEARRLGYRYCALHTLASNPARRFYDRRGYLNVMTTTDAEFEKLTGVSGNVLYVKDLDAT